MKKFTYNDIELAVSSLNLKEGDTILVRSALQNLGFFVGGSHNLSRVFFELLYEAIGKDKGTLVVPTGCLSLCNTDKPFDIVNTPSELGVFSEYVRKVPEAIRSFHPFFSYTSVGKLSNDICGYHPKTAFGLNSPKDKLINFNAKAISIGLPPNYTCTTVHHAEFMVGVPYRYVKEFYHPILVDGVIKYDKFYLYVLYLNMCLKRNRNKKLWERFKGEVIRTPLGNSSLYIYSMKEFYNHCITEMQKDMYVWLDEEPQYKVYIK